MHSKKKYIGDKVKDCQRDLIFVYKNKYGGQFYKRTKLYEYNHHYQCRSYMSIISIIWLIWYDNI